LEQNLTDYFLVFYRNKGKIVFYALFIGIVFYFVSFLLPKYFEARTSILPSSLSSSDVNLGSLQSVIPSLGLSAGENKAEIFVQILKSRTIGERLIDQFDLKNLASNSNIIPMFWYNDLVPVLKNNIL